jgi:hypothetical protein
MITDELRKEYNKEGKPFLVRFDFTHGMPEILEILSDIDQKFVEVLTREGTKKELTMANVIFKRDVSKEVQWKTSGQ